MTLLLVAHGTRDPAGVAVARSLGAALGSSVPSSSVRLAFVDVLGPRITDVLASAPGPVTVLPAFLASGHHVRVDVPCAVAAPGVTT